MIHKVVCELSVLCALHAVVYADDAASDLPKPAKPGQYTITISSGGFDRTVRVHVPKGYRVDALPPLILALHGAGGNGRNMMEHNGWAAKADSKGFIVVAPDGLPAFPRTEPNFLTNPPLWNSGQ